jgi:hypothetical protein
MNRVDDTSDACARSPARAPFTVTWVSDAAPGARLGRSPGHLRRELPPARPATRMCRKAAPPPPPVGRRAAAPRTRPAFQRADLREATLAEHVARERRPAICIRATAQTLNGQCMTVPWVVWFEARSARGGLRHAHESASLSDRRR